MTSTAIDDSGQQTEQKKEKEREIEKNEIGSTMIKREDGLKIEKALIYIFGSERQQSQLNKTDPIPATALPFNCLKKNAH